MAHLARCYFHFLVVVTSWGQATLAGVSKGACRDQIDFCASWASTGGCETNAGFMHKKCALSCGVCPIPGTPHLERMPSIGWGTCCRGTAKGDALKNSMRDYLRLGGKLIDTALAYDNHRDIGAVLQEPEFAWIRREDLFITSKVPPGEFGQTQTEAAVVRILDELNTSYVDLVLLHAPLDRVANIAAWRALEKVLADGRAKAIGVSNFIPQHFLWLVEDGATVTPMNNQISLHPGQPQRETLTYCRKHGISVTAFNSVKGRHSMRRGEQALEDIAAKHGKTVVQVLLRWGVDHGLSVIPGCTSHEHLKEALDVAHFGPLTDSELAAIGGTISMGLAPGGSDEL